LSALIYLADIANRLELLELYLELILARFGLLEINNKEKEPEEGIREAVCSIVYAAPR
jgi:vacuolar protein sorting-associated protein IST1